MFYKLPIKIKEIIENQESENRNRRYVKKFFTRNDY